MSIRIDISFEDFVQKLRERLREVTEAEIANGQDEAQEVLNDLDDDRLMSDHYRMCFSDCYELGYTLSDAFDLVYHMGQHVLDEDTCLMRMSMVRKKYGLLRDRAAAIWSLARHHHIEPTDVDKDVMRKALMKHTLPIDDRYDVAEWILNGWFLEKENE